MPKLLHRQVTPWRSLRLWCSLRQSPPERPPARAMLADSFLIGPLDLRFSVGLFSNARFAVLDRLCKSAPDSKRLNGEPLGQCSPVRTGRRRSRASLNELHSVAPRAFLHAQRDARQPAEGTLVWSILLAMVPVTVVGGAEPVKPSNIRVLKKLVPCFTGG